LAIVEHRAWYLVVEDFLLGRRKNLPLDYQNARFDAWLKEQAQAQHGNANAFSTITDLHRKVHGLAEELCASRANDQDLELVDGLDDLRNLREELLANLELLLAGARRP
jgi:hypothetical protein